MDAIFKGKSQTIACTCKKTKAGIFQFLVAPHLPVQETWLYLASHSLMHPQFLSFRKEGSGTCCCHFICAFSEFWMIHQKSWGSSSVCKFVAPFYPHVLLTFLSFLNIHRPIPNKAPVDTMVSISLKHAHTSSCCYQPTWAQVAESVKHTESYSVPYFF